MRPCAPLRDVQEAAFHTDPRTTMRYDRARVSLDRHATYISPHTSLAPPGNRLCGRNSAWPDRSGQAEAWQPVTQRPYERCGGMRARAAIANRRSWAVSWALPFCRGGFIAGGLVLARRAYQEDLCGCHPGWVISRPCLSPAAGCPPSPAAVLPVRARSSGRSRGRRCVPAACSGRLVPRKNDSEDAKIRSYMVYSVNLTNTCISAISVPRIRINVPPNNVPNGRAQDCGALIRRQWPWGRLVPC
jgi:hypothetical protein